MQFIRRRGHSNLWLPIAVIAIAMLAGAASFGNRPQPKPSMATASHQPRMREAYGHLPLSFEENRGQTDARVKFLARGGGYSLFLTPTEAVLKLRASSSAKKQSKPGAMPIAFHPENIEKPKFSVVRILLEGANPNSTASGVDALPGHSNYFIGKDRAKWRTGIATYGGVRFESVYPGINLVYRGTQGRLEYDFVIAPHADPSRIKMNVEGAYALSLDRDGNLVIKTAGGEVIQKAPVIYQESHGTRYPITGGYALMGEHSVTFKLGAYDRSAPLIIDPLLTYVSYLGGSFADGGNAIAVDSAGAAWVVGATLSTDFPVTANAFQAGNFGNVDAFVTKVSPDGSSLIYSTYAGSSGYDEAIGIGLDGSGNAFVMGTAGGSDFPVSSGAYQTKPGNVFVTALDSTGGLIYSTYFGSGAVGTGIAVDSAGDAFISGGASNGQVPTAGIPYQDTCLSGNCAFVTKFNPLGTSLVYSTYVPNFDGAAIGLNATGEALIAGITFAPAFQCTGNSSGRNAGCITLLKLDSNGSNISAYGTTNFISSPYTISLAANSIAVSSSGDSDVIGYAVDLRGGQFALAPEYFLFGLDRYNNTNTAVLPLNAAFSPSGPLSPSQPVIQPKAIAADPMGNLFITGLVLDINLPTIPEAFQPDFGGGPYDAFLIELDPGGSHTLYATFLGGSASDIGFGLALDSLGNAYVTGSTNSSDFPVTSGVFQSTLNHTDSTDSAAFVARIGPSPKLSPTPSATPTPGPSVTATPIATASPTATPTVPRTPLPTRTTKATSTAPTMIATPASTSTPTLTATATATSSPTITPTPTATASPIGPVTYSPKTLKFPKRRVGTVSGLKFVTMTNPKKNHAVVSITGVTAALDFPFVTCYGAPGSVCGFGIDARGTTCLVGTSLAPGRSCRVAVLFSPVDGGSEGGTLHISGSMSNPAAVPLSGSGR